MIGAFDILLWYNTNTNLVKIIYSQNSIWNVVMWWCEIFNHLISIIKWYNLISSVNLVIKMNTFVSSILMVKYIISECRFEHLKSLFLKVMGEHYGPSCEWLRQFVILSEEIFFYIILLHASFLLKETNVLIQVTL